MKNSKEKQKINLWKLFIDYGILIITFVLLIIFSIKTKQKFIKLLPCLVTLFVNLFDSKVNKYGKLIGATNCVVYSIGYFQDGLYGNALSALLYSLPLQLITFAMWNRNKYKQGTVIRSYSTHNLINLLLLTTIVLMFCIGVFTSMPNSKYGVIQGITFGLGLIYSLLMMFGFIEGAYMAIPSTVIGCSLYVYIIFTENPASITYLIISLYTLAKLIIGAYNWTKLYKEQATLNNGRYLKNYEPIPDCLK